MRRKKIPLLPTTISNPLSWSGVNHHFENKTYVLSPVVWKSMIIVICKNIKVIYSE